jgi:hypothetical protein
MKTARVLKALSLKTQQLSPQKLSILLLAFLVFIAMFNRLYYMPKEQLDLRSRIVGSRVMKETTHSPYFYRWQEGDDIRLKDPDPSMDLLKDTIVSRVTVTPALLIMQKPLAKQDYSVIKYFWFFFQLLAFFIVFLIFYFKAQYKTAKYFLGIAALLWFFSMPWRDHLMTGQVYVLYPFVLTLAYLLADSKVKYFKIFAGVLIGLFVFVRPTFILFSIPLLLNKEYRFILGGLLGIILGFLFFVLPDTAVWYSYQEAMSYWASMETHQHNSEMVQALGAFQVEPNWISSIQHIVHFAFKIELNTIHLLTLFTAFVGFVILFLRKKICKLSLQDTFLFAIFLIITADFFLPAARFNYYAIQWIFPLFLILSRYRGLITKVHVLIAFGLILQLFSSASLFEYNNYIGEVFFILAVLLFIKEDKKTQSIYFQ